MRDAFQALADVHERGITHRALRLRNIEVTAENRVRFRDFDRAHLPSAATIAPALDDAHASAAFRAPGATMEMFQPADDLYSLALCLVQWLYGDGTDQPDHELARRRAQQYPEVGSVLARCLSRAPGPPFTAADAVAATTPEPTRTAGRAPRTSTSSGRERCSAAATGCCARSARARGR